MSNDFKNDFNKMSPRDLYADVDPNNPSALAARHDSFKSVMADALERPKNRENAALAEAIAENKFIQKNFSTAQIDSVTSGLDKVGFLGKSELTLAGPGTTGGFAQYDLEAPAKNLVPRKTPLRNRIPREKGRGTAHEFKRITGISGSGTGGVAAFHPGIGETETNQFGALQLRRGKLIDYAGDHVVVPFRTFSVSSRVTWQLEQAAIGFQDLTQTSAENALYAAMLLEERMLLSGRGTASGYSGNLATPSAPTVTTPAASGGQSAVTGVSTNAYAYVVARTYFGSTPVSAAGNSAFTAGDVVVVTWPSVEGAETYDVYLAGGSSAPAMSSTYLVGSTSGNTLTVQGALPTSAATANNVTTTNNTATDKGYDGIIPTLLDPDKSGSITYVNGPLTNDDVFQDAFEDMYTYNEADPQTILCNGADRRALSTYLQSTTSSNYQIQIRNGDNASVGQLVTGVQNEVTGTMLDLEVHRYVPRGLMPIMTWTLPMPGSNVSNCWSVVNVTDYQGQAWPRIELAQDFSVSWIGTLCAVAPMFSGIVAGITA